MGRRSFRVWVRKALNRVGVDVHLVRKKSNAPYETVRPFATYSPWNTDADFREIYERIQENTLVDQLRCYELWQLVGQAAKLPAGALIEVGVWQGGTGALIAAAARRSGIKDPVYLCDTFRGVVKASSKDTHYKGGEHADTSRGIVERLLNRLNLGGIRILEGIFPDDTGGEVKSESLRFVHIDVDVYESARGVNEWAWPRLVPGGMIVYDDYGFLGCDGVTRLVDEQRTSPDRIVLHNLNGHAVVTKLPISAGLR
jgi:O-methyltransferase